ncbi:YoaK family protein [Amycolatopsis cynarae]|uniref:YoaK family protein n=1 Tax=Amycolatopsis cynarae TaxID=2995223 RepID=A0ABY7BB15_9PSEU|nr:YoaK family protein [Amycolatopsis sp. HUAS 11-8]WAL69536.1 YoaK family protein [Amycolatopsis sp. HUAS 11-8]
MAVAIPIGRRRLVAALLTLTAVTGLIDAVSYLGLGRVFVANMTGNVVFLGFALQPGAGVWALASVVAIGGFLLGALLGGRLGARLATRPRTWLTTAFATETGVLAVVAVLGGSGVLAYRGDRALLTVAVLAVALGVQNSTVRRLAAPDLTTTVLTLTLTGLAADSVLAGGTGSKPHRRLGSVAAMLGGAAVGALLLRVGITVVIAVSAALVAAVTAAFALAAREHRPGPAPLRQAQDESAA